MKLTEKLQSLVVSYPVNRIKDYVELEEVLKVLEEYGIETKQPCPTQEVHA